MISKKLTTILATATISGALLLIPTIANAWTTGQSAQAICLANSTGAIKFSFTNKETDKGMKVSVKDSQTGATFDMGTVDAQQTKSGEIDTGKSNLGSGTITFFLTWVTGSGSDSRTANYSGITCVAPTATPTPTSIPTATPTPTVTPTDTPMPSATPTPTDVPTVTPTPTNQNTDNCDDSTQVDNNNANNNCNNNNNNNDNNNQQSQDQTQNNNQDVNVTVNNNNTTQVLAAETPTKLPSTGADASVWMSLFGLIPAGFGIRKFALKK